MSDLITINISIDGVTHTIDMKSAEKLYNELKNIFEKQAAAYVSPTTKEIPPLPDVWVSTTIGEPAEFTSYVLDSLQFTY